MYTAPLAVLLLLTGPARAGVAASAEAGAEGSVPRVNLQTTLNPVFAPGLTPALTPSLQSALTVAPAPVLVPTALSLPALPLSAVPAAPVALSAQPVVPAALFVETPLPSTPDLPGNTVPEAITPAPSAEEIPTKGAMMFDGASARAEAELPVFGFKEAPTTVESKSVLAHVKRGLQKMSSTVGPPLLRSLYDDNSRKHYYHGLSLGTLEKAVDGGGALKARLTFISDEAGHPYGYARASARRTGTAGVVLQFDMTPLDPLIVPGHYNPRAPERGEKWEDVPHWFQAERDIPLSAQTELSKKTVLDWMAGERDAHPEDASWPAKIAKFEAAFGAKAPVSKPKEDLAATARGRLGLDRVSLKGGRWVKDGKLLERIGQGSIGFVDVHPTRPGLVVKTIAPSLDQMIGGLTLKEAIEHDERSAALLASAGIGPRVLGGEVIDKRRVTVRERIFGKTMRDLISDHAFGAEEEALVLDMVRRMAAKSILVSDLKPENIMLGTTERDGVRRAWFVDGGVVESFAPGLDEAAREQKLLDYPNVVGVRNDYNARQVVETIRTLRFYIRTGREESAMPRWRLFLKRLGEAFFMSGLAAANK